MTVSYQNWYTGDTYPSWDIPLARDGGTEDITNVLISTFKMTFRNSQGVDTVGTGTFSVKANSPAEIYYKPSPADVANAFSGSLIVSCYFPPSNSNLDQVTYDPITFVITQA